MSDTDLPRDYPLPGDDGRFTNGVVYDVIDVLARHGYPEIQSGRDFVELRQALFGFLYRRDGA